MANIKKTRHTTSLAVQWLRLHAPNAEGLGSILGQRTGSYMLQLKILHTAAKTQHSQINKYIFLKKKFLKNIIGTVREIHRLHN